MIIEEIEKKEGGLKLWIQELPRDQIITTTSNKKKKPTTTTATRPSFFFRPFQ